MTWQTPWAIGGGPAIPPEVMRMVSYGGANKSEGILDIGDLRVRATTTPSNSIIVGDGGGVIRNRSAGGDGQSYVVRNRGDDTKTVPGTTTARSDLVVARIVDPQYDPWPVPANRLTATYIETFIVQNVPSNTTKIRQLNGGAGLGYSAIALARIDRAANQNVVNPTDIINLREVAQPRRQRSLLVKNLISSSESLVAFGAAGEQWPDHGKLGWTVDVPDWATRARCVFTWTGAFVPANSGAVGNVWGRLGYDSDPNLVDISATQFDFSSSPSGQRTTIVAADDRAVPAGLRDKSIAVSMRGRYFGSTSTAQQIRVDAGSAFFADIEWLEAATEDV